MGRAEQTDGVVTMEPDDVPAHVEPVQFDLGPRFGKMGQFVQGQAKGEWRWYGVTSLAYRHAR